jgi:hypothetical protein
MRSLYILQPRVEIKKETMRYLYISVIALLYVIDQSSGYKQLLIGTGKPDTNLFQVHVKRHFYLTSFDYKYNWKEKNKKK